MDGHMIDVEWLSYIGHMARADGLLEKDIGKCCEVYEEY